MPASSWSVPLGAAATTGAGGAGGAVGLGAATTGAVVTGDGVTGTGFTRVGAADTVLFGTVAVGTGVVFEVAVRAGWVAGEDGLVLVDVAVSEGMSAATGGASSAFVCRVSDTAGLSLPQAARKAAVVRASKRALFTIAPFSVMRVLHQVQSPALHVPGPAGCELVIEKDAGFQWCLSEGMRDMIRGGSDSEFGDLDFRVSRRWLLPHRFEVCQILEPSGRSLVTDQARTPQKRNSDRPE